jgi:hypothetical protein
MAVRVELVKSTPREVDTAAKASTIQRIQKENRLQFLPKKCYFTSLHWLNDIALNNLIQMDKSPQLNIFRRDWYGCNSNPHNNQHGHQDHARPCLGELQSLLDRGQGRFSRWNQ